MFGAIEAGGTKFVCAVSDYELNMIEMIEIPTTTPLETMGLVKGFFSKYSIESIGIGSFGPANIDRKSKDYGCITNTPKPHWSNFNMIDNLKEDFPVPIIFDTDVNIAALGEVLFGAAKDVDSCIYITVGTGFGVGAYIHGQMLQGLSHPEMGHIYVKRHPQDQFEGVCPFHNDCLEGLAAGPAIESRWGKKGVELQNNPVVWEIEGYYLAQALWSYISILSPQRIIMGGGVMKQRQLFPIIYEHLTKMNNGYAILPDLENYISFPGIDGKSAIMGALYLAKEELKNHKNA